MEDPTAFHLGLDQDLDFSAFLLVFCQYESRVRGICRPTSRSTQRGTPVWLHPHFDINIHVFEYQVMCE